MQYIYIYNGVLNVCAIHFLNDVRKGLSTMSAVTHLGSSKPQ